MTDMRLAELSSSQQLSDSSNSKKRLEAKILDDHLERATRCAPVEKRRVILDWLQYVSAEALLNDGAIESQDSPSNSDESKVPQPVSGKPKPGGLSLIDLRRIISLSPMTSAVEAQVSTELKKTLCAVQEYYSDECAGNAEEQLRLAYALPDRIRAQQERILHERSAVQDAQAQIHQLVTDINEIHPRLQAQLVEALTTLPPLLNETQAAQAGVLSATIEASLLKLSLIRTRAYIALYGYASRSDPDCTMHNALVAAREKVSGKQREQEEEERALDARIAEYDNLMGLVGGGEGGFAQIVEDMARVKKETEECRKDLRRLGWTGD